MRALIGCVITVAVGAGATAAAQFGRPLPIVEPFEALIPIGRTQAFQLLDASGHEILSDEWSVSDPKIASLTVDHGHAILTGRSAGSVSLVHRSGARSGEIDVQAADQAVQESRWALRPLDGRFVLVFWAASAWGASVDGNNYSETAASYYYEDRGAGSSHIRAVRRDGLQVWQWPTEAYREAPHLLCGDFTGGVLATVGAGARRALVSIDITGRERWRVPVPGLVGAHVNVNHLNVIFFVSREDAGTRVVGLNGRTGEQVISIPIDTGHEVRRNLDVRGGRIVCAPGRETTTSSPLRATPVITNAPGVTNLAYAEWSITADAGRCTDGAAVAPADVRLHITERLMMLDVGQDFVPATTVIEERQQESTAADAALGVTTPLDRMIVGPDGTGNYLPLRKSVRGWPGTDESAREELVYRVSSGSRKPMYRVSLPPAMGEEGPISLLLGDHNTPAYMSRGRTLLAVETADGRERWRWTSKNGPIQAEASLQGDVVLVRERDRYTIVDRGRAVESRSESFMLFVMKLMAAHDD